MIAFLEGTLTETDGETPKRLVRITLEPSYGMSGPMGTAIISRVPSFRVQRDDWRKSVFCTISHLAEKLTDCGLCEDAIRDAMARAVTIEDAGDWIEVEVV
jgi:hypothetical protein